jgi:hypothetical protein
MCLPSFLRDQRNTTLLTRRNSNGLIIDESGMLARLFIQEIERVAGEQGSASGSSFDLEGVVVLWHRY